MFRLSCQSGGASERPSENLVFAGSFAGNRMKQPRTASQPSFGKGSTTFILSLWSGVVLRLTSAGASLSGLRSNKDSTCPLLAGPALTRESTMKPKTRWALCCVGFWLLTILPLAHGANLQSLCSFPAGLTYPYAGLVQGRDGNFYGTTYYGGTHGDNYGGYGTVFKVTTDGMLTTLASFANANGANPYAGVIQGRDGNFYGTTANGGMYGINGAYSGGYGTAFMVTTNGVLTSIHSFAGGNEGQNPQARLCQGSDGNFYGTAANGGSGGYGTVFMLTTNGTLTTLASFSNTNGATPYAGLVQGSDGNLYGTTVSGGDNGYGTVFQVTTNGILTTLVSFNNTNGANPYAGVIQGRDGNFYGTTVSGGTNGGYGTVFMITTNGTLIALYSFGSAISMYGDPYDGGNPYGGLVQGSDGNLYGTTAIGGAYANVQYYLNAWYYGYGTVFMVTTNGELTTLHSFGAATGVSQVPFDGGNPYGQLVLGRDGNFYGTTYNGGTCNFGTAFMVKTNGTFTSLASMSLNPKGANPYAGVIQGSDGNFYGTTRNGGMNGGYGTVFMATTNGTLTALYSFTGGNDGAFPKAGVIQGGDGNIYGTTWSAGQYGYGTVFMMTTNGTLNTLVSFANTNGANPDAGLIQGSDGNFYGTTVNGGTNGNYGTVFMVTTNGVLTTLVSFAGTDGANPYAGLIQDRDGNFYGTTEGGGTNGGGGTVFTLTTNGSLNSLLSLTQVFAPGTTIWIYPNGAAPFGGLVQSDDGNFYGTTLYGATTSYSSYGSIFRMSTNGVFTNLVSFSNSNGANPYAGLIQGRDGSFYGTTYLGGPQYHVTKPNICNCIFTYGTVFQVTINGTLTNVVLFANSNGANPNAGVIQGSDNNLYGTTYQGGANADNLSDGYGTVFRIILAPTIFNQPTNQTVAAGGNVTFAVGASSFGPVTYQWRKNTVSMTGATNASLLLTNVSVTNAANYSVAVSGFGGTTLSSNALLSVVCPTITVSPATPPTVTVGQAINQTNSASGGTAPYTFARTSGTLPPGVTLSTGGVLSGSPIRSGTYIFTVRATDSYGCTGTIPYTLVVNCPTITLGTLPPASVGTAYNQTNSASGGAPPYTFAVTGGSLPPGFVLSSSGALSGAATNAGNYNFTIKATDTHFCIGTNGFNLAVNCPAISVSPATLPTPLVGTPYSQAYSANGGTAPYTFAVSGGRLPSNFALSGSGVLSGTPTNLGNYSFTVMVADTYGCTGSQNNTLEVAILLVSPSVDSNGWFHTQVVGPAGSTFVVLASTNVAEPLSNWAALTTNSAPNGIFDFTDANGIGFTNNWPQRFYRARLSP